MAIVEACETQNTLTSISHLHDHDSTLLSVALPPELLGDIFLTACRHSRTKDRLKPDPSMYDYGDTSRTTRTSIAHTCHRWREIALGTPSLWHRIHIELVENMESNTYRTFPSLPVIALEAERSLKRPLHLHVEWESMLKKRMWDQVRETLDSQGILARCQSLKFGNPSGHTCNQPYLVFGGTQIHYESLRILIGNCALNSASILDLLCVPQLEQLSFCRATYIVNHQCATSLVRLRLSLVDSMEVVLGLLQSNPRLQTLILEFSETLEDAVGHDIPSISLPRLLQASFTHHYTLPTMLLSSISAPELNQLRLEYPAQLPTFQQFPKLQLLVIEELVDEDTSELIEALYHTQTLKELVILTENIEPADLFRELTVQDSSGVFELLPALRALRCNFYFDNLKAMDRLLSARNADVSPHGSIPKFTMYELYYRPWVPNTFGERHPSSFLCQPFDDPFDPRDWELLSSSDSGI